MTDLPVDPASESIVDDIRRKVADKAALVRGQVWQAMGCPTSPLHMDAEAYHREFRGRIWCANRQVFEQVQQALRVIICPKCLKEESYGAIEGTRLFITVEDDVMTVFPAVGHFVCHHCGFEEWQPLKHDPRVQMAGQQAKQDGDYFPNMGKALGQVSGISPGLLSGGVVNTATEVRMQQEEAMKRMKAIQQGIDPGMGAIWGMSESERIALHRLYQQTNKATSPPPPIVGSRAEAEELLKLAPIERRQAIVQKMRDKGLI